MGSIRSKLTWVLMKIELLIKIQKGNICTQRNYTMNGSKSCTEMVQKECFGEANLKTETSVVFVNIFHPYIVLYGSC